MTFDPVTVPEKGVVTIAIRFALPTGCHWTENAPSAWQLLTGVCILCNVFAMWTNCLMMYTCKNDRVSFIHGPSNLLGEGC